MILGFVLFPRQENQFPIFIDTFVCLPEKLFLSVLVTGMQLSLSLDEIKQLVGPVKVLGDSSNLSLVTGIASLDQAQKGDLSFLGNSKYRNQVATTHASLVLLPEDFEGEPAENQVYFFLPNPSVALALVCQKLERKLWPATKGGVHPSAVIANDVIIADDACVGPLCVVGSGSNIGSGTVLESSVHIGRMVAIGNDCRIKPQVVIADYCEIGDRVILHPGCVLGSDGFGFETIDGVHKKVPQVGRVIIENDVEIGASTTIDRARFSETRVGEGTKIDNLVQIAHNVRIGRCCLIAAQAGISGSTVLEDYVVMGGQSGVSGHIKVGKGSVLAGKCSVFKNLAPGSYVRGTPAEPIRKWDRMYVMTRKLPEFFKRLQNLESQFSSLEQKSSDP